MYLSLPYKGDTSPTCYTNPMELNQIYQFAKQVEKFKMIERFRGQFFWKDYPQKDRYESTADHTWRMAIVLILLVDQLEKPVDTEWALKMTLIHDLPEIISGDPSPLGEDGTGKDSHAYSATRIKQKYDQEYLAAKKLFSTLPSGLGQELLALWVEFEEGKTTEAQLVRALDKWEAKLQVLQYTEGNMMSKHLDFTLKYRDEYFDFDPAMRKLMNMLSDDFKQRYRKFES